MRLYCICDEAGAKGYAKKSEQYPGELGLFAGCFFHECMLQEVLDFSSYLCRKYFSDTVPHVSSVKEPYKSALIKEVYGFFQRGAVRTAYEAIYAEGAYQSSKDQRCLQDRLKDVFKDSPIKTANRHLKPLSIHQELFLGFFLKATAVFRIFCNVETDDLFIATDKVDRTIFNAFIKQARDVLDFSDRTEDVTAYDTITGKVLHTKHHTFFHLGSLNNLSIPEDKYSIKMWDKKSVLLADVVAHTLLNHLENQQAENLGIHVNSRQAIIDHPLADYILDFDDQDDGTPYITDSLFMHPTQEDKLDINKSRG